MLPEPFSTNPIAVGWGEFLGRYKWDWFGTFTFRTEIHPEAADKRFRVWVSKLNRRLYGVRWYKHDRGVRWARALEMQRRDVIHYHALVGGNGLVDVPRLPYMEEWNKLAGYARIEPPRDSGAVNAYCSKYIVKGGEIDIGGTFGEDPPSLFDSERGEKTS